VALVLLSTCEVESTAVDGFRERGIPDERCSCAIDNNMSFRGYADYMETASFTRNLDRCISLARQEQVALTCAEAVPWRCHRSLIADALVARGIAVSEIVSGVQARPHVLTLWAEVTGTHVTYPGPTADK
jgi:uncharacterized protein (DUF488 family)